MEEVSNKRKYVEKIFQRDLEVMCYDSLNIAIENNKASGNEYTCTE